MKFVDKVAIVTGASTGIGRAIALALGGTGYTVVVNSKSDSKGGEDTVRQIAAAGGQASYVKADVSVGTGVRQVFDHATALGETCVLVNNAGATRVADFGDWTEDHWLDMLSTNLVTTALMSQEFVTHIGPVNEGSILNVGSIRGIERFSRIGAASYSAAKAGVVNLTGALARALAPRITVNCICPGVVSTSYVERADPSLVEGWLSNMPIQRFVQPQEVAETALLLLGNRAINGAVVVVDGGWTQTAN